MNCSESLQVCRNRQTRSPIKKKSEQMKENPVETVIKFSSNWDKKDPDRLVADLVSISNETNRKADTYCYVLRDSKLIDPETNRPVEEFVHGGTEKKVFSDLQNWANTESEGLAIWISPPLKGVYPCAKVIISRIVYDLSGNKVVLNSANLFDNEIVNPDYKRKTLYRLKDSDEILGKIAGWIVKKNGGRKIEVENYQTIRDQAVHYSSLYQSGFSKEMIANEMRQKGFLGEHSISCGTNINSVNSFSYTELSTPFFNYDVDGWHAGTCRICGNATWVGPCEICKPCESKL